MCIAAFAWNPDSNTPLLLAANRDEFFARPTAPMHWWPGERVLAGRDLKARGTWLGITQCGRIALLTNIRTPALRREGAPSRGDIVKNFLESTASPAAFARELATDTARYEGFNFLCGQVNSAARELWFINSAEIAPKRLNTGIYGLSNASLDTAWPKLIRIKQGLRHALAEPEMAAQHSRLLRLLRSATRAADRQLPSTGVPLEWERALSAIFIRHHEYGTRVSTIVRISGGQADLTEVNYAADVADAANAAITFCNDFSFDILPATT